MTAQELIYQVYEDLNIQSDDRDIDERLVLQLINQQRALWVDNTTKLGNNFTNSLSFLCLRYLIYPFKIRIAVLI